VRSAATFHDLGGWLTLWDYSAALVLELPPIDSLRRAVLKEARRLSRGVPLVALTKAVTPDIEREANAAGVVRVLPTDADPEEIVTAVERAGEDARARESTAENAPGNPEDGDIVSASGE
jgi:DNA-binding NtrC family response regulator